MYTDVGPRCEWIMHYQRVLNLHLEDHRELVTLLERLVGRVVGEAGDKVPTYLVRWQRTDR
jgi:hypothetical protein